MAFVAGNVVAAMATSIGMLLVVRLLTGSLHGLVAGVATAIAAGLVPAERRGQAISLVVGGITVSTVVGVPLGTLIGQALGWHAAFVAIVALGGLALVATLAFVPPFEGRGSDVSAQTRAAFAPSVVAMLGVGVRAWSNTGPRILSRTSTSPLSPSAKRRWRTPWRITVASVMSGVRPIIGLVSCPVQ